MGEGVDDGLRLLAALGAMESLEPDFCDDPGGEASVTIIESASPFELHEEALPAPADAPRAAPRKVAGIDAVRPATYHEPVEEAVVEIFEGRVLAPATTGPSRKKKKGAVSPEGSSRR